MKKHGVFIVVVTVLLMILAGLVITMLADCMSTPMNRSSNDADEGGEQVAAEGLQLKESPKWHSYPFDTYKY